jgi:hypothetical protein
MPPKKDKKKKPMKRTQTQKGKGQSQKQTQIVNISLARPKSRSAPKPVSNIPPNMIRLNQPSTTLISQPMVQPVREPLKEVVASSQLLGSSVPVPAPVPVPVPVSAPFMPMMPESEPVKSGRGRPKGSKNRVKSPEELALEAMSKMEQARKARAKEVAMKRGAEGPTQREIEEDIEAKRKIKKPAEKERPAFVSPEPPIMELPKK